MPNKEKPLWRDVAGMITAFIIVVAFVSIGFLDYFSHAWLNVDKDIMFNGGWMAAMLSLASTAFGYMVGAKVAAASTENNLKICTDCPYKP